MKKRKDSFFGIHFDFHASKEQIIGEDFRPEIVAALLDRVRPDFVQCDTKGHFGYSSYPTLAGSQTVGIKHDVLKMWRTLTKERDIALYAHHSGLFDMKVAKDHPSWTVHDEEGNANDSYISVFSPYADEVLIPQLKEIALDYDLDGAWIDGDCWGAFVDYSEWAVNAYKNKYGKNPPKSSDGDFEDYRAFCAKGFEDYVAHYVAEIKKVKPDFQITSNWIYSAFMPCKMSTCVDFLSGDYSPVNSVETARHDARCLMARNIPWDLMAWGQTAVPITFDALNRTTKEYEQYCQEASVVIALGGGFQFFNLMYGGGGMVQPWAISLWERVSNFVREREFLFGSKPVHQVGIIYPYPKVKSQRAVYDTATDEYSDVCSVNNAFLDSLFSTEFIYQSEPHNINDYPLVFLPYGQRISEDAEIFKNYVLNGGRLVVDRKSAPAFADFASLSVSEEDEKTLFLEGKEALASFASGFSSFEGDYDILEEGYDKNYHCTERFPLAIGKKIGKGYITFMCFDFAKTYKNNISTAIRDFLKSVISKSGFKPYAKVEGTSYANVSLMEKSGKKYLNIVNTAGPSGLENVRGYNEVPKIGPIKVEIFKDNITQIKLMPDGKSVDFKKTDEGLEFEIPSVHIHTIAVIEED